MSGNLKKGIRPGQALQCARPTENFCVNTRYTNKTGAGNGIRTRDTKLGKLVLYQLSYARS